MSVDAVRFQIQIAPSKQVEFLKIIESLQKLGVIENFARAESYVQPGEALSIDALVKTLEESEQQIAEELSFTPSEAKMFLHEWKQRRK